MVASDLHQVLSREEHKRSYLSPRGTQSLVISIIFTSLATILVVARVYTRTKLIKRVEANDWMIVIALLFSFVFMAFFIGEALNGMGMHLVDIPTPILIEQMKAFWITIPFYNAALLCAKASILMQYFRVFPSRRMRHTCWVMLGLLATYGSWAVLSGFLNCIPVARFWDPTIKGSCLSSKGLWFSNASMHITTDLAILIIPIPALAALELPMKQRVALISIFALGGFVCVTSICRLVALKTIADSSDPTYDNIGAATWSAIECNTGIICACLPTLRPLISRIIPQLLSSLTASRHALHSPRNRSRSKLSRSRNNNYVHDIDPPAYWGMAGMGGLGVRTTITTHIDDLEYGSCEGDAERVFKTRYGVATGAAGLGIGAGRTQARVFVGSGESNDGRDGRDGVRFESTDERDGRDGIKDAGVVVVRTEVRTDSSSSSSLVPLAGGEGGDEIQREVTRK
ncbi:hypothetical protein BJY04DRAFT_213857 [Aspergillus karnatakaensis]|uniref:uncharacterized protein n=1 Tax=Aspergillus karnatakaensis TaxID=1810916 RepID=UPI003CCD573B